MGGDNAPKEIINGILSAVSKTDDTFIVVGNKSDVLRYIKDHSAINKQIEIVHTEQIIAMDDDPLTAIQKKKDSSMVVALKLLADGKGDALVSAGNTGALFSGATLIVKRTTGIKRAAIGTLLPGAKPCLLLDAGANVSVTEEYLEQFALIGSSYVFRVEIFSIEAVRITTAASVAVAKALNCGAKIKWVNDLYLDGKKICGILTESVKSAEYNYIMIGVGINLTTIDFPDDIRHKAGAIGVALDKDKTIAAICDNLSRIADAPFATDYLEYYRKNMMGIGETITYSEKGQERTAKIEGINDLGALLIIEGDEKKCLCSGEITITSIATDSR